MNKVVMGIFIGIVLGSLAGIVVGNFVLTGRVVEVSESFPEYTYTTTLCKNQRCVSVLVECNNGEIVNFSLMSEYKEFGGDWENLRGDIRDYCE